MRSPSTTKLRLHEFDLANSHHIIMDITSFQILLSDIGKVYSHDLLGPRPRQYAEFSMAQQQALEQARIKSVAKAQLSTPLLPSSVQGHAFFFFPSPFFAPSHFTSDEDLTVGIADASRNEAI
ncbi:hypothetical protein F5B17DRAFT_72216 [Nemania serpens]|nr:hypothetical protein F5B17DRAFT_72216 [Nemania serpens]